MCPRHFSRPWGYCSELMIFKSLPSWSLYSDGVWGIQMIQLISILFSILAAIGINVIDINKAEERK